MPKSLRLGADLEKTLERYCEQSGETASAVIRESVADYIARKRRKAPEPTAWELGKDLFGADKTSTEDPRASTRFKKLLGAKLRAKHHR
jgi:hypothetical protein